MEQFQTTPASFTVENRINNLYKLTKERYEKVGKDPLQTITYHPTAKDVMDMEHDNY